MIFRIAVLAVLPIFLQGASWDYDKASNSATGPAGWAGIDAKCGGDSQSPIDIDTSSAETDSSLEEFTLSGYATTTGLTLGFSNNGHTATLTPSGVDITASGGGLGDTYKMVQLHFHWGPTDSTGSEHTIDDKAYPLEMHIVHHKDDYSDLSAALASGASDAAAVLGFMFEISNSDNSELDPVINALASISAKDSNTPVNAFAIEDLFGDAASGPYWRYSGSLTTPTCNEIIIWTVFERTVSISATQLAKFRTIMDSNGDAVTDNFRPVQDLNGRKVTYYSGQETTTAAAAANLACLGMVSLLSLLATLGV